MLEVRNDQTLDEEIAQLQMSVDGGAPELVNIIANLPPGETASFAFARSLDPGSHVIRFSVGDSHMNINVNVEGDSLIVSTPTSQPTTTATVTIITTQVPDNTAVPTNTSTPIPTSETAVPPDLRHRKKRPICWNSSTLSEQRPDLVPSSWETTLPRNCTLKPRLRTVLRRIGALMG